MDVHEDVAFDPRVGAIEVQAIIAGAVEDVVDDLEDGAGPIAAREINGVVERPGVAKIIVAENAVTAGRNSIHTVEHLRLPVLRIHRRPRIGWENTILNDERTAVKRDILDRGRGR